MTGCGVMRPGRTMAALTMTLTAMIATIDGYVETPRHQSVRILLEDGGRTHFAITDAPQTSATSSGFTSDTPVAPAMPSALQRISSMTRRLQLAEREDEAMRHRRTLKQDDPMVEAAVASTEAKLRQASLSGNRGGSTAGYGGLAAESAHPDSSSSSNTPSAGAGQGRPSGRPSTQSGGRRLLQSAGGYGTDSAANMIGALRAASFSGSGSASQPAGGGQGRPGRRSSTQSGGRRRLLQNAGGYGTDSAANMIGALRAASLSSSGSTTQPAGAGQGRPGGRPGTQSGGRRSLRTII